MMYTSFTFGGLNSYKDFGLTIERRKIGNPSKIKRTERVPFSNQIYDFSNLYNGQEFDERSISYDINIACGDKSSHFYDFETEVVNWLMGKPGKQVLTDDLVPGYYFLAEVVDGIDTDFIFVGGRSRLRFTAYPFKISELEEGNDIWDTFNFLNDYSQMTKFNVNGSKVVTLYNQSATTVTPQIVSSSNMTIKIGNSTYEIPKGITKSHDFMLSQNENKLTIEGTGTIEFKFYKELI